MFRSYCFYCLCLLCWKENGGPLLPLLRSLVVADGAGLRNSGRVTATPPVFETLFLLFVCFHGKNDLFLQADSTKDDLEPLFDYRRVQPLNIVCLDDDCLDTSPVPSPKRRKFANPDVAEVDLDKDVEVIKVVNVEEEDWLAPPPVVSTKAYSKIGEDSTIKELRRRKQELLSFAQSAKSMLQELEESANQEPSGSSKPSLDAVAEQSKNPAPERAKIVTSIQNKDEIKQFRIYIDDKFEKLFSLYANKAKVDLQSLVFSFDGNKINLAATPASIGMEDDDIIEVHEKKS